MENVSANVASPAAEGAVKAVPPPFFPGQKVWYRCSTGEELMARVKSVEGAELNLNIRDDADVGSVRPRDDTEEDAMSDEDQYDEDKLYSSGEKVWYKSSTGEMMKARVEEITADNELNLNIKEDAPWDRVTKRDDTQDGAMSDDDEYDHLDESSDEDSSDADDMDETSN